MKLESSSAQRITYLLQRRLTRNRFDLTASNLVTPAFCFRDPELIDLPESLGIEAFHKQIG